MRQIGRNQTRERIMDFIRVFFSQHEYAPTVRDILKGCAISSTAVVQHHLDILEREGRIQRDPAIFRSIRLTALTAEKTARQNTIGVPLLGLISAGQPIPVPTGDTWTNQAFESMEVPVEFISNKRVFALKVKGYSMIDALIDDGDTVLMEVTNTALNGDMVAVWLKDRSEVTLKRIFFENDSVKLQPANQTMQPIIQPRENVEIQGRVIGVIRKI